jgi:hypothetical protein
MDNTQKEVELLIHLYCLNIKNTILVKDLAKKLNISRYDPSFAKLRKILIDNNIAVENEIGIGRAKNITINFKKLNEFILETNIYKNIINFIKTNDPVGIGVIYGRK